MPEFTRRWNNFSTEVGGNPSATSARSPYVTSGTSLQGTISGETCSRPAPETFFAGGEAKGVKSLFKPDVLSKHLLARLRNGSQWLTAQHAAWLDDAPDAATDERFSVALSAWAEMERSLRMVYDYQDCIFGAAARCPEDAPVQCDFCVGAKQC